MICPRCHSNGYSEENKPAIASSLEDNDGEMVYAGSCILCGYYREIIETPVKPMPKPEFTRLPDGSGGFVKEVKTLTGVDRIVWECRETIKLFTGMDSKYIAKLLNKAKPGSRINCNMVAASLRRLKTGQIAKLMEVEA